MPPSAPTPDDDQLLQVQAQRYVSGLDALTEHVRQELWDLRRAALALSQLAETEADIGALPWWRWRRRAWLRELVGRRLASAKYAAANARREREAYLRIKRVRR